MLSWLRWGLLGVANAPAGAICNFQDLSENLCNISGSYARGYGKWSHSSGPPISQSFHSFVIMPPGPWQLTRLTHKS
jgi:hypothetical protein